MANVSTLLIARYDEKLGKQGNLIPSPHLEGVLLANIFTLGFIAPQNSPFLEKKQQNFHLFSKLEDKNSPFSQK